MKEKTSLHALILCGGQGTRLWPLSTKNMPKQYLKLVGGKSLFQWTLERIQGIIPKENTFIITNSLQKSLVEEYSPGDILTEPQSKNTAPCILFSLFKMLEKGVSADSTVVIMPSDHVILNQKAFQEDLGIIVELVSKTNKLVTLGIPPHFPHTGYGYICFEKNQIVANKGYNVERFVEKPNLEKAREYLQEGNYLWNAGIFIGKIKTFLEEFQRHCPELYAYESLFLKDPKKAFEEVQNISIDYAIMEKSSQLLVYKANFDWNDLGSWNALESLENNKSKKNIYYPENQQEDDFPKFIENSSGNIIINEGAQSINLIDVHNLLIINSRRGLVIAPKDKSQQIKDIVDFYTKTHKELI